MGTGFRSTVSRLGVVAMTAAALAAAALGAPGAAAQVGTAQAGSHASAAVPADTSGTTEQGSEPGDWSYTGARGPSHWGELGYPICAAGRQQSPIDLRVSARAVRRVRLPKLRVDYGRLDAEVVHTGRGIEARPAHGARPQGIVLGGIRYTFLQFHPHAPSEHEFDGLHYPAEIHFVHRAKDGRLAVVGVPVRGGDATNRAWQPFVEAVRAASRTSTTRVPTTLHLEDLLPGDRRSYRYRGSLTTPPCTQGVAWTVLAAPVTLSRAQLSVLTEAYNGTNRPVQPLHGRVVLTDVRVG